MNKRIAWHCRRYRRQIQGRLDGELTPAEESALAEHLAGCPACRREWETLRAAVDFVAVAPGPVPRPLFAARVQARLAARAAEKSPPRQTVGDTWLHLRPPVPARRLAWMGALAFGVLAAVLAWTQWGPSGRPEKGPPAPRMAQQAGGTARVEVPTPVLQEPKDSASQPPKAGPSEDPGIAPALPRVAPPDRVAASGPSSPASRRTTHPSKASGKPRVPARRWRIAVQTPHHPSPSTSDQGTLGQGNTGESSEVERAEPPPAPASQPIVEFVLASQPPPLAKGGIEGRDAEPEETEVVEYALGTTLLLPIDPKELATIPVLPVRTDLGEGRVSM